MSSLTTKILKTAAKKLQHKLLRPFLEFSYVHYTHTDYEEFKKSCRVTISFAYTYECRTCIIFIRSNNPMVYS